MEKRIVSPFEQFLTTTVNDIEHIESQSLYGVSVIKVYFQPGAKIEAGVAQVTAVSQTAIRIMPPGTQPPLVIRYDASDVPILQLSIGSDTLSEQTLFDQTINVLRRDLILVPGLQTPYPYGGKQRQIMVDIDLEKLYAYGISPADVSSAINAQNLILPAGTAKIGKQEYQVKLNSSPPTVAELNDLPIKSVNGATVYVKDVAHVRDGFIVQTNIVHAKGKRGVLLSILKAGGASTLDVVSGVFNALPAAKAKMLPNLYITPMFDQSVFVRASVEGVIKEAAIAAGLTGMMILLFLGSWRSTLIVMISIPLSIMVSIIILDLLHETLNVMTLGGMALAVGILVDDATVEIENIHRNLHQHKKLVKAILDGASQIAVPAFVSTLCICIVFVPVVFISGAAKFLFTPLAMAVVFAMMTSYLLSRTLVPTMVHYLLASEVEMYGGVVDQSDPHAMKLKQQQQQQRQKGSAGHKALIMLVVAGVIAMTLVGVYIQSKRSPALAAVVKQVEGWVRDHKHGITLIALIAAAVVVLIVIIGQLNLVWRVHGVFNKGFEKLQRSYGGLLAWAARPSRGGGQRVCDFSGRLVRVDQGGGDRLFPDGGRRTIAAACTLPAGNPGGRDGRGISRRLRDAIRKVIPGKEIVTVLDNIGIPNSGINLSLSDGSMISPADGEILVSLNAGHRPTAEYMRLLRKELTQQFPRYTFYFARRRIS